jgi:hypothetical protein
MKTISKYAVSTALLLSLASGLAYAQQANAPAPTDQQTAAACDDRNDGDPDCMGGYGGRHHGKGRGGHGEGRGGHHGRGMKIIDANNDGFINADEAAALADAAFMHIDQNRDSVIDQTEASSLQDRKGWRAWFGNTPSAEVTAKLKAAFAERDTDKDGKVTKLEFMTFAQGKYAALDTAKDGKVSPWAFRAMPRL